eukprot:TRINITY_DN1670_c0_g1_i1.p1 TRINITY_DN1670_c0_g1~~TRINITY_DN1670_c0_g1_i1.p1  ORF type:complete len:326 (+),score=107.81 TRINITY_DN1670_c0_g1_i1:36-1013(+)
MNMEKAEYIDNFIQDFLAQYNEFPHKEFKKLVNYFEYISEINQDYNSDTVKAFLSSDQEVFEEIEENNNNNNNNQVDNENLDKYYRKPLEGDIDYNNQNSGKNYASGVLPCCFDGHGQGYILLGSQKKNKWKLLSKIWDDNIQSKCGWCNFQGWQDKGDYNCEFTAAREAVEESLGAFGSFQLIREMLEDETTRHEIYQGCFLISLGELDVVGRNQIIDIFNRKLKTTIIPEMERLHWFKADDLLLKSFKTSQSFTDLFPDQADSDESLDNRYRPFFLNAMKTIDFESDPLRRLIIGVDPFPNTPNRYQLWRLNKFIPTKLKYKK